MPVLPPPSESGRLPAASPIPAAPVITPASTLGAGSRSGRRSGLRAWLGRRSTREAIAGYLYLTPNLIGFLVFTSLPILAVFAMSFFEGSFVSRPVEIVTGEAVAAAADQAVDGGATTELDARWVGLENYRRIVFEDVAFRRALWNTLFLMLAIPISMALSLGLAILLNRKIRGRVVFRTIYFLPTVASGIALFLMWRWIYNRDFGLLNAVLSSVGLVDAPGPDWLGDPSLAKPALMMMGIWIAMGGTNMVLYLAGLTNIDPALYEAAEIDGATAWQKFRHITWPQLGATTFFIFTTNLIGGFQIFDQAFVMTEGGPWVATGSGETYGATRTLLYMIYDYLYVYGNMGYASALSVVLFGLVLIVTAINWRLSRRLLGN